MVVRSDPAERFFHDAPELFTFQTTSRIIAIAPGASAPIAQWLSGSAAAWTEVLEALTSAQRATIVATMRAYEAALEEHVTTERE